MIEITEHAKKRLVERVGTYEGFRTWKQLVKHVRYHGTPLYKMSVDEYNYIMMHLDKRKFTNSMKIRLYRGFFYIFRGNAGHARTLITVIKYEGEGNAN